MQIYTNCKSIRRKEKKQTKTIKTKDNQRPLQIITPLTLMESREEEHMVVTVYNVMLVVPLVTVSVRSPLLTLRKSVSYQVKVQTEDIRPFIKKKKSIMHSQCQS